MATFGKTDVGGSFANLNDGFKQVFKFTAPEDGTITKLTLYCDGLGPGAGAQEVIKGLVYADSAGAPGARLGIGDEITILDSAAAGWVDLTFAAGVAVTSGTVIT